MAMETASFLSNVKAPLLIGKLDRVPGRERGMLCIQSEPSVSKSSKNLYLCVYIYLFLFIFIQFHWHGPLPTL